VSGAAPLAAATLVAVAAWCLMVVIRLWPASPVAGSYGYLMVASAPPAVMKRPPEAASTYFPLSAMPEPSQPAGLAWPLSAEGASRPRARARATVSARLWVPNLA
jgi:hypothetical protein